jgi:hypothetical protein
MCGHTFAPGHRIRLAISPTYWPHAWPSPDAVRLEVATGSPSRIELPLLEESGVTPEFPAPDVSTPLPGADRHAERVREIVVDDTSGRHEIRDRQTISRTIAALGARYVEEGTDAYTIVEGEPLSALVRCERETRSESAEHPWRVNVVAGMSSDHQSFFITETYTAHEDETLLFERSREYRIPRDHV